MCSYRRNILKKEQKEIKNKPKPRINMSRKEMIQLKIMGQRYLIRELSI